MHSVVVVNGELPTPIADSLASLLRSADLLIAVDGGLRHCAAVAAWPHLLIGDLDSAPTELVDRARRSGVLIEEHPTDKEATDLELALERADQQGADAVTVVAPFGGRLDHQLAIVSLLASDRWQEIAIAATDGHRQILIVRSAGQVSTPVGTTLSLLAWNGPAHGVTTRGLRWPLVQETLQVGSTRGVSNVAVQEQLEVTVTSLANPKLAAGLIGPVRIITPSH